MLYFGIDRKEIEWTTKNRECGERYIRHALMVTHLRHAVVVALRDWPALTLHLAPSGRTLLLSDVPDASPTASSHLQGCQHELCHGLCPITVNSSS
jgi:hypothetical protein